MNLSILHRKPFNVITYRTFLKIQKRTQITCRIAFSRKTSRWLLLIHPPIKAETGKAILKISKKRTTATIVIVRKYLCKKRRLKNLATFTEKHLYQNPFYLRKRLWHKWFPVNFAKFPRTPFYMTPLGDCF